MDRDSELELLENVRTAEPPGEEPDPTRVDGELTEEAQQWLDRHIRYASRMYYESAREHDAVAKLLRKHEENQEATNDGRPIPHSQISLSAEIGDAMEDVDPEREQEISDLQLSGAYNTRAERYAARAHAVEEREDV